jgi:CheY-like chemotaxis protein
MLQPRRGPRRRGRRLSRWRGCESCSGNVCRCMTASGQWLERRDRCRERHRLGAFVLGRGLGLKTILVVQPERHVAGLFSRVLGGEYTVLEAISAQEALDACRHSGNIDLLIIDVVLPVVSGMELAFLLKQWLPRLRIILTADALPEFWSESKRTELRETLSDSIAILKMPFSPDDLRARVIGLIGLPERVLTLIAGSDV